MASETWLSARGLSLDVVLRHFPTGLAWHAWRDATKNAGKLMQAVGDLFETAWSFLDQSSREIDYRNGTQFLGEWETALGLPDACLPPATTTAERRAWIEFRLRKKRWNTISEWEELATLFGVTAIITPGYTIQEPSLFATNLPHRFRNFPKLGRFRVYIDLPDEAFGGFPYDGTSIEDHRFPVPFGGTQAFSAFRCFIERIAPANVLIIWNEFPAISPGGNGLTFDLEFDEEYS